jgi:3-methyladenine DNA glycosylase/8-oxoguanine DNA glycosylase
MRKAILHLKKNDPVLRRLIERAGPYKISYHEPDFPSLARAIVYQQLNGKAAATIWSRVETAAGELTPERILALTPRRLRAAGLSRQKLAYLRDLAAATAQGRLNFAELPSLDDETVVERLTAVKGIGRWTAHMFLIFALRRPDVLPVGDYGIRAAIRAAYELEELPNPARMEELAVKWRPYCSVASWYLWRSLDGDAEL